MAAWNADLAVAAAVLLGGVALLLAIVGLVAYARLRHGRLMWVAVGFLLLSAQGGYLTWLAYQRRAELAGGQADELLALPVLALAVVLALYFAVLKR